ncbi:MAG: hypothetical protein ACJAT8_001647 [Cellvibrionaceae bacterium]
MITIVSSGLAVAEQPLIIAKESALTAKFRIKLVMVIPFIILSAIYSTNRRENLARLVAEVVTEYVIMNPKI